MHNSLQKKIFAIFSALAILFVSCTNKSAEAENINKTENQESPAVPITTVWYYFTQDQLSMDTVLVMTSSPEKVPANDFIPWTEAVRISGIGLMYDPPLFIVNKTGILPSFNLDESPKIEQRNEFHTKTADGFYKTDAGSLIRLYTNTIFSSVIPSESPVSLLRYNAVNKELVSLISPENFKLDMKAQLSSLDFNKKWYAVFKTEKEDRVTFDYFSFLSFNELLKGSYNRISQEEFVNASAPLQTLKDKEGIDNILKKAEKSIKAEFFSENLKAKKNIFYSNSHNGDFELTAYICELENKIISKAILFEDGNLFYFNSEMNQWINLNLPQLPEGFAYTYFSIQKGIITAAWEEQRFFEIGRSGILIHKIQ